MSALENQVAGTHYLGLKIQPMTYSLENGLNAAQHSAVKYVTRYRSGKGSPLENLRKAIHSIELLIEQEGLSDETPEGNASIRPAPPYSESETLAIDLGEEVMDAIYRRVDETVKKYLDNSNAASMANFAANRQADPTEESVYEILNPEARKKAIEFINTRNRDFVEGSATYGLIKDLD